MGYGDIQAYNPESKIPTPNLNRLCEQGMRFTDAHSASAVCTPTRYALLMGRLRLRGEVEPCDPPPDAERKGPKQKWYRLAAPE